MAVVVMIAFGCLLPSQAAAGVNKALQFDGNNDYLRLPQNHGASCPVTDFSFEVWVKLTGGGQIYGAWRDISVRANATSIRCVIWPGGTEQVLSINTANNANQWVYLAFVRQGSTLRGYRNGVAVGSLNVGSGAFEMFSGWGGMHIGSSPIENEGDSVQGCFGGIIDEMRISSSARAPAEITANWNNGNGKLLRADATTIALWHFDEGEGQMAYDVTRWNDGFLGWFRPPTTTNCPAWVDGFAFPSPTGDFSLYTPDFHARLGVPVLAVITGAAATDHFKATLTGPGVNIVVCDQTNPPVNFRFSAELRTLAAGDYTLTAQLLNAADTEIKRSEKTFTKPYDGIPRVGIDEHNALVVNGAPTFPVAGWAILVYAGTTELNKWVQQGAINCQSASGSGGFGTDLSTCAALGIGMIGGAESWDPAAVTPTVTANRDNAALWVWGEGDEPDLNGISPAAVRAVTDACHVADPQHPVYVNVMGHPYSASSPANGGYYAAVQLSYSYPRQVVDIYSFDYYPLMVTHEKGTALSDELIMLADKICDHVRDWNYDLVPVWSFVDVAQFSAAYPVPTPQYIRIASWVNIIHGVKGIEWFPWHMIGSIPAENFAEMARLVSQTSRLAPVILGPDLSGAVVEQELSGGRIDIMTKEDNGKTYVFAANLKDQTEDCRFTINATLTSGTVEVFDESRTITVSNREFTDTFAPFAVHIYLVPATGGGNHPPVIASPAWADPNPVTLPAGTTVHVVASDPDGDPLTYAWSKVSGPGTANLAAPTAANSSVTFSAAGGYVLRVTVSDGKGGSVTSDVSVTVMSDVDPRADVNHDGVVNALDLQIIIANFGKTVGTPGCDARADANRDNVVNALDLQIVIANFGQTVP